MSGRRRKRKHPGGRPPLPPGTARSRTIKVLVTAPELALAERVATARATRPAAMGREALIDVIVASADEGLISAEERDSLIASGGGVPVETTDA